MRGVRFEGFGRSLAWAVAGALLAASWPMATVSAQTGPAPAPPGQLSTETAPAAPAGPITDPAVTPAGCSTCGNGLLGGPGGPPGPPPALGSYGCGGCICKPGRRNDYCDCCCDGGGDNCVSRLFCGLYHCICCPDPCYEPRWTPLVDSAFFVESARPVTQMRLRYDDAYDWHNPDRSEFFWAREGTRPTQILPPLCEQRGAPGKGPNCVPRAIDYKDLSLYTEGATERFGLSLEMPYRHWGEPDESNLPISQVCCSESGFADLVIGTKTVLLDCELTLLSFGVKTSVPTGNFTKGLGTGHVSMELSLLGALRLTPNDYLQGQLSYWFPIGGDTAYQGDIFHAHLSYNRLLWCPCTGLKLIGTAEANEWSILGGLYTSPDFVGVDANGQPAPVALDANGTVWGAGAGLRLYICDKIDIGVGYGTTFGGVRWYEDLIRTDFRWRF
jgi:hypothetical protein